MCWLHLIFWYIYFYIFWYSLIKILAAPRKKGRIIKLIMDFIWWWSAALYPALCECEIFRAWDCLWVSGFHAMLDKWAVLLLLTFVSLSVRPWKYELIIYSQTLATWLLLVTNTSPLTVIVKEVGVYLYFNSWFCI